jgi:hypothetical protein
VRNRMLIGVGVVEHARNVIAGARDRLGRR